MRIYKIILDWRADGWRWIQQGTSTIVHDGFQCKKYFFYTALPGGNPSHSNKFKREAFWHPDKPLRYYIRYIGDSTIQVPFPHGNATSQKKLAGSFVATRKSNREEMKSRLGLPTNIYKDLVCSAPKDLKTHVVVAARDIKQVHNFQTNERRKNLISHDAHYNLQNLAFETNFIKNIVSYPDLIVIMYLDSLWEKVRGLLNRNDIPHICLSYDTTFNLGDIYVSVLIVRYEEFVEGPAIPLMIMMHERKLKTTHQFFWQKVAQYFPDLINASNIYLVTDEEAAIVSSIREFLPYTDTYRCWIHVVKNAKLKLQEFGVTNRIEYSKYKKDIYHLLNQKSEADYYKELATIYMEPGRWNPVNDQKLESLYL